MNICIDGKECRITDLMKKPVKISSSGTLRDALEALLKNSSNIGVVVDADNRFIGTVSTLDIIKAVLPDYLEGDEVAARFADESLLKQDAERAASMPVCDFLDREEATIDEQTGLLEAAVLAIRDEHGRIVVLDKDQHPIGVLSRTEIKRVIAAYLDIPANSE